jgi:CRISPR-associated protein Cpf1
MRYTYKDANGEEIDFILSPVADKNGIFFDSRTPEQYTFVVPQDADANGAYNIARKCLYYIQNISDDFKLPKKMSKVEWMNYTQENV